VNYCVDAQYHDLPITSISTRNVTLDFVAIARFAWGQFRPEPIAGNLDSHFSSGRPFYHIKRTGSLLLRKGITLNTPPFTTAGRRAISK
jgi:hypothetical protein